MTADPTTHHSSAELEGACALIPIFRRGPVARVEHAATFVVFGPKDELDHRSDDAKPSDNGRQISPSRTVSARSVTATL